MKFPSTNGNLTVRVAELSKNDWMMSFSQAAAQNDTVYWYPDEVIQVMSMQLVANADHAGDQVLGSVSMYPKELAGYSVSLWYSVIHYLDGNYQSTFQRFSDLFIKTGSKIGFQVGNTASASSSTLYVRVRLVPERVASGSEVVYVQEAKSPCGVMDFLGGKCNV